MTAHGNPMTSYEINMGSCANNNIMKSIWKITTPAKNPNSKAKNEM